MSGGGGLDVGKELAQLDKDLSLSENAPMIASAAASYFGVPLTPVEMGAILGTGRAIDKGSVQEGINWGLQGYGGGSLGAAMAPGAVPTPPGGAPIPVETATPMPVGGGAVGPETGGTWFAGSGTPAAGATSAAPMGAGIDAIGSGINAPYVGQQATMAPNMAAPAAQSGTGIFDKATAAYSGLNPIVKYGIPLAAASMLADRKGAPPGQTPYDGPLNKLKYDPDRYRPLEVKPPVPYTPVYKDYRNMAGGGIADLGGYSDGGRMLKGPGDGMSDSIPATISNKQPARLADGEFVVPADVVSHLGNGSTDAGAKQLYKMMDKVRVARTGKKMQGRQINPRKYVPA